MAIMLLAITLFLALAAMFILATQFSDLKERASIIAADNAQLLISKIANSPEFSCGDSYGSEMSSCIDADKVINLKKDISQYGNGGFWGVDGIQIRTIYPQNTGIECTALNYPNCDIITVVKGNGTGISSFVSLCGKISVNEIAYNKCNLAEIIITYSGSLT